MLSAWSRKNLLGSRARLIGLVWLCFVLRGAFYSGFTPIWEGFDEWAHYGYIDFLETHGRLPLSSEPVSAEIEHSLNLVPAPWVLRLEFPSLVTHDAYWTMPQAERLSREGRFKELRRDEPRQDAQSPFRLYEAQQPPLYYLLLYLPHKMLVERPLAERIYILRLMSVLLTSLVIPLGFATARLVFGADTVSFQLVAVLAVIPELMINIARVGNESLAIPIYTGIVYCCLRLIRAKENGRLVILAGILLGLGLLTKAYFLAVAPVLSLLLCWCWITLPGRRKQIAAWAAAAFLAACLVSGGWYWRNIQLTGSLSGHMFDAQLKQAGMFSLLENVARVRWFQAFETTFFTHIWFGNWSFLQVRTWIYRLAFLVCILAMAGIGVLGLRFRRKKNKPIVRWEDLGLMLLFYFFFALAMAYYILIAFTASGQSACQGWYLYCLVVPELVLVTLGIFALLKERVRPAVLPVVAGLFALLDLYTVHFLLIPYYSGLLAHNASGALPGFRPAAYAQIGLNSVLFRLAVNKPEFLTAWVLACLWVLYLGATLAMVAAASVAAKHSMIRPSAGDLKRAGKPGDLPGFHEPAD